MLPNERMALLAQGKLPDRVPFVPTIYEHAAALIGVTPSAMAQDEKLIVRGQLDAYRRYGHDLVAVGIDIYNIEAEALGCEVQYFANNTIPSVERHILGGNKAGLAGLSVPDPESAGRMPLLLEAATAVQREIGQEVPVAAAIVGPFTLAALLRGYEDMVFDLMEDEAYVGRLLDFALEVAATFGEAMVKRGLGVAVNDSWITPPLLSPKYYKSYVLSRHQELIRRLKAAGATSVGLVSGGNTQPIADYLVQTGSSLLMADYGLDLAAYKAKAAAAGIILRGSIQASLLQTGSDEDIRAQAREVLSIGAPGGRFVLGCGVVPFDTEPRRILLLRELAEACRWQV
ncbi:MAG: uroporphyrinogen decarboxylase family protein [Negativicutes bacterium]|nr:uroporphyrinogen decarboxylase family protein [Negativicutes bacterium]